MSTKKKETIKDCLECPYYKLSGVSHNELSPVFSLRYMRNEYSLEKCEEADKIAFVIQMIKLSGMSWSEIIAAPRHGLGSEKISQNCIKTGIPNIVTQDTTLLGLRFSGKKVMVGFRDKDIFHILWFDRNFKLYSH
jgi:hypothetical protein